MSISGYERISSKFYLFLNLVFAIDFVLVFHASRMMDFLLIGTYKFGALIFANSLCELFVHLFLLEVLQGAN